MDDMDMATRCVYAMWEMADSDRRVRRMLGWPYPVATTELRRIGEAIVANPHRTKTSLRIFTRAIATRLDE